MEIWQSHSGSSVGGRVFVALMICEFDYYQYFKISKDLKEFFADSITSLLSVSNFILLRVPRFYQGIYSGSSVGGRVFVALMICEFD